MSPREARLIRVLRVDLGCSWGRVAELYGKVYPREGQTPTQQWGGRLCEMAAEHLGEKPGEEPWN